MTNIKLKFAFEKETKGTVRYRRSARMARQRSRRRSVRFMSARVRCLAPRSRRNSLLPSQASYYKSEA
jgi:hypothetical protein